MRHARVFLVSAQLVSPVAFVTLHAAPPAVYPQWPPAQVDSFRVLESQLIATPDPERLRALHDSLASRPHVAGTDGDKAVIDALAETFRSLGLETQVHEIWPLLPRLNAAAVEIADPTGNIPLRIQEEPIAEDSFASSADFGPAWNAYSGSGDVTAEVVYANYGTKADFDLLAKLGVSLDGKVVLTRYGGNFRGYKARFAQAAGAAACLIYNDPADSGYMKGIPYPEGGYAHATHIERGSLQTLAYTGDPLTPNVCATQDAARLDPASVDLPRIPVQPIAPESALQILSRMRGGPLPELPAGWQGGLPIAYRVSGGESVRVRVMVDQPREITRTANVLGMIRGSERPDQLIIVGCHHDAWTYGAADPTCGLIALLESARAFAEAARTGNPPKRTIVFAGWGAEEMGIIGSSEWVEANRESLSRSGIAYINLDMASMGVQFGASAAPSLKRVIAEAAGAVPSAEPLPAASSHARTVLEDWLARAPDAVTPLLPAVGTLGGGSDHVGFLCHAGVPSASLGGGGSKGTSYHSAFDTLDWYRKVVGNDYASALLVSRMTTAVVARLAYAPVLPIDPVRAAPDTRSVLLSLSTAGQAAGVTSAPADPRAVPGLSVEFARLWGATLQYERLAFRVAARLGAAQHADRLTPDLANRINDWLVLLDRAWLDGAGIPDRPWFRNLAVSPDADSGYSSWELPLFRHAIERRRPDALAAAEDRYLRVFADMSAVLREIDRLIPADVEPAAAPAPAVSTLPANSSEGHQH